MQYGTPNVVVVFAIFHVDLTLIVYRLSIYPHHFVVLLCCLLGSYARLCRFFVTRERVCGLGSPPLAASGNVACANTTIGLYLTHS